jgi:hypothetical protein
MLPLIMRAAELIGELYSEVAESTDPLHRDQVAWQCARVPQGVVGVTSSAYQRRRLDIAKTVRNRNYNLAKLATNYAAEELIRDSTYSEALSIPQWLLWPSLSHHLNR